MNLKLEALSLVRWLHFLTMSVGLGAAVVALLLSGFEEEQASVRGLAATVWAKVVAWSFRLSVIAGLVLLALSLKAGYNPLAYGWAFHLKLTLVFVMLGLSETAPKALAAGRRGGALLALVLFLMASFTMYNRSLFQKAEPKAVPAAAAR